MVTQSLIALFSRDLNALISELTSYSKEHLMWMTSEGITNSAGNLALHLVGNLNHFIGFGLGDTGYVRKRDLEFSQKNIPREVIVQQIEDTVTMINKVLPQLSAEDLQSIYKHRPFDKPMTTEYFLIHLAMHLSYHLGQINYHRHMLDV